MIICQATPVDLDALVPLFDGYRQFYGQPSDVALAREFLAERMEHGESVILMAFADDGSALGFTQLFPSFSSLSAARIFVLNDLFVSPHVRRGGVGAALLRAAAEFGRAAGAVHLELCTAVTNTTAQALYEREGWKPVREFMMYELDLRGQGMKHQGGKEGRSGEDQGGSSRC